MKMNVKAMVTISTYLNKNQFVKESKNLCPYEAQL